jgi:hypothetical protein
MLVLRTQTKGSPKTDVLCCEMVRKVCASLEVVSSNTDTADTTGKGAFVPLQTLICTGYGAGTKPSVQMRESH